MTLLIALTLGALGAYLLYRGAAYLIDGATSLAHGFGVPLAVIGLTVVALGTSAPELVVGVIAGLQGDSDLVLGNILGSNMANLGLVLGVGALLFAANQKIENTRLESFALVIALAALYALIRDGGLSRVDGAVLVGLGVGFMFVLGRAHRPSTLAVIAERSMHVAEVAALRHARLIYATQSVAGMALLYVGARMVVTNAEIVARAFGVSDLLIGLTIVAIGTSLPELVTSFVAAKRKAPELMIGNALGSNILNVFLVLGATVIISPVAANPNIRRFDLPALFVTTLLTIAILRKGRISRLSGGILLATYIAYLAASIFVHG